MGWYCHPDTMAIAAAQHAARKQLGTSCDMNSLDYKKAYRAAYAAEAAGSGFDAGLTEYLKELDDEIGFFERGGTLAGYADFLKRRSLCTGVLFNLLHLPEKAEPRLRWEVIQKRLPNPDDVLLVPEIYAAIDEIDRAVHWQVSEPQWWLDMMAYQRVLGKRISDSKDSEAS